MYFLKKTLLAGHRLGDIVEQAWFAVRPVDPDQPEDDGEDVDVPPE